MTSPSRPLFPTDPPPPPPQLKLFTAPADGDDAGMAPPGDLSPDLTLDEFYERFFLPVRLTGADPKTVKEDRTTLGKWRSYAGPNKPIGAIDRVLLAGFVPWLLTQPRIKSIVTAAKHLARVQTFLRAAGPDTGDGLCAEVLAKVVRVKPPRCPQRLPDKAFSLREIGSWLDACQHARPLPGVVAPAWWQSIVLFCYNCPLRFEALTALRWEWVITDDAGLTWLKLEAEADKKDRAGLFYLSSHALAALQILCAARRESGLIFGLPLSPARLYTHAKYLLARAAIDPTRQQKRVFHGLRAAADTELRRMGNPTAAKRALGHSIGRDVAASFYTGESVYRDGMERLPQPSFARWREPQLRLF